MPWKTAEESHFGNMIRNAGKLMEQLQKGYCGFRQDETWMPQVNLYENESAYLVCVELCGVEKEKIELVVVENQLRLRGTRPVPLRDPPAADEEPTRYRLHLMEIDYGAFYREVDLPEDVDQDRIGASYVNGMLWVELPKKHIAPESDQTNATRKHHG